MELELTGRLAALLGADLTWLAWILTYSGHALLWASAVALVVRLPLSSESRHTAWKAALFGPLLTTLFVRALQSVDGVHAATAHLPQLAIAALRPATGVALSYGWLPSLLLAAGLFGLVRYGVAALQLARRLHQRRPAQDSRLLARCAHMQARFALPAVTLSQSAVLDGPLVIGLAEICIPDAVLNELDTAEVDAVFAHELAHLERRDGVWFPLVGLLNAAFCWHPVTRWLCAQVRHSAERACDDRCVQLTGEPRALARALTRIAAQALALDGALPLPTMAQPQSSLVARVAHLTSATRPRQHALTARAQVGLALGAVAMVMASVSFTVHVAGARNTLARFAVPRPSTSSTAPNATPNDEVRALELEQELRHAREMQAWLEASRTSH